MPRGFTLWFTGLSGAGKSTLASRLRDLLVATGRRVEVLDGDDVRTNLSKGLGFSREDRDTNIRRIGYVARLLSRNGVVAITAAISPYRGTRDEVRSLHEAPFIEVWVDCALDTLLRRDPKGLYAKALTGELPNLSGISDPYEPPSRPEIVVRTDRQSIEESAEIIRSELERRKLVTPALPILADSEFQMLESEPC